MTSQEVAVYQVSSVIAVVAIVIFTLIAAYTDTRHWKIPNWLTVPTAICGLLFHCIFWPVMAYAAPDATAASVGWALLEGIGFSLAGFAVGFGILFLLFATIAGGAGDVKYVAALGAWLGPLHILIMVVVSFAFAAALSMLVLVGKFFNRGMEKTKEQYLTVSKKGEDEVARRKRRRMTSFGIPAALATYCVLAVLCLQGKLLTW